MTMNLRHWFIFKAVAVCSLSLACRNANASNFLARGMPATQSGTYNGQGAALAVDSDTTGTAAFVANGASQQNVPAWLQVDLGQNCIVYSVTVTAPPQDYQYLSHFIVTVQADTATDSAFLCATYNSLSVQPGAVIVTTCSTPLVGRYVTVTRQVLDTQPRYLSISDLQVNGTRISGNQAYYQPATESGISYKAFFAVDDDPTYFTYSVASTADISLPAWWQVDLGEIFGVKSVWLMAISSEDGIYYLQNFSVTVDTSNSTSSQNICYTFNYGSSSAKVALVSPSVYLMLTCTQPMVGRYVTVRRLGGYQPSALLLCDVQVFGDFLGSIPTGPFPKFSKPQTATTTPPLITPSAATTLTSTTIPQTMCSPSTNFYSSSVAGIVVGAVLGAALLVLLLVLVVCAVQKRKMREALKTNTQPVSTCACRSRATIDFASKEDGDDSSRQNRPSDESGQYEKIRTGTNNVNNTQAVYDSIRVPVKLDDHYIALYETPNNA